MEKLMPPTTLATLETPVQKQKLANLYRMKFKSKGVISEKFFMFEGTPREATQRAIEHCAAQGYSQHIWTEAMVHDLDVEDAKSKGIS